MNENVVDLLVYLFENYLYDTPEEHFNKDELFDGLQQAGFSNEVIEAAFDWLEKLPEHSDRLKTANPDAVRLYSQREYDLLQQDGIDFVMYLENTGILNSKSRELLINSIFDLEADNIDVDDLQWLALIILYSQPGQEQAFESLQDMLFESPDNHEH